VASTAPPVTRGSSTTEEDTLSAFIEELKASTTSAHEVPLPLVGASAGRVIETTSPLHRGEGSEPRPVNEEIFLTAEQGEAAEPFAATFLSVEPYQTEVEGVEAIFLTAGPDETEGEGFEEIVLSAGPDETKGVSFEEFYPTAEPDETGAETFEEFFPTAGPDETGAETFEEFFPAAGPDETGAETLEEITLTAQLAETEAETFEEIVLAAPPDVMQAETFETFGEFFSATGPDEAGAETVAESTLTAAPEEAVAETFEEIPLTAEPEEAATAIVEESAPTARPGVTAVPKETIAESRFGRQTPARRDAATDAPPAGGGRGGRLPETAPTVRPTVKPSAAPTPPAQQGDLLEPLRAEPQAGHPTPPPPVTASSTRELPARGAVPEPVPDPASRPGDAATPPTEGPRRRAATDYALPAELTDVRRGTGGATLLWGAGVVLLCATLALQYLYYHRLQLVERPALRPLLTTLCELTGCQLPPRRDLGGIELTESQMQFHPNYEQSLLLSATLTNRADFAQPYPLVEVVMTDIEQRVVARRRFPPAQYLANYREGALFAVNSEVPLLLEVVDPGNQAVGFEFRFY
jgi:hypothetical protein